MKFKGRPKVEFPEAGGESFVTKYEAMVARLSNAQRLYLDEVVPVSSGETSAIRRWGVH